MNVSSKQVVQILTKIWNATTSFTHIVIHIMHKIFLTGDLSPQQLISSMAPSLTCVKRKNRDIQKQFQHRDKINVNRHVIKIVPENFLNQLITPSDLHQSYMRITR